MRRYSINIEELTLSTATDFFQITPAAEKPCEIVMLEVRSLSETADAWTIKILRGPTLSGTANVVTARPMNHSDVAYSGDIDDLTDGTDTTGTPDLLWHAKGDVRVPAFFQRPPGEGFTFASGTELVVRSDDAIIETEVSIYAEIIEYG